ncbi:Choline/ethanolaminephosphotransferase [Auriculariales sp. MPI-PUGE-AT-0066]|nr:Choline/ethanolaminephosphotransferase [Auriculariales sp. MPI-PUGE-AT-0066]
MFWEPLFSHDHLQNLKYYKYAAIDKSPTTKYGWDLFVKLFPLWVAPNAITLAGLGFILINLGTAPAWVYYGHALGLFLYQTFDNVDGRQARRTKSSSALGHTFDHTIDTLNTIMSGILQIAAIGAGGTWHSAAILLSGAWAMWFVQYHTNVLYLGYLNGPTEGILIAVVVHLISASYGLSFWLTEWNLPSESVATRLLGHNSISTRDLFISFVIMAAIVVHTPACLYHVKKVSHNGFLAACAQNGWFLAYNALILSWMFSPHSRILRDGHLLEFGLVQTFTFGKLGSRIILSHLTKAEFPGYNDGAFLPWIIGSLAVEILPKFGVLSDDLKFVELVILHLSLLFSGAEFLWWWTTLCQRFCSELNINCLTIKHSDKKQQ